MILRRWSRQNGRRSLNKSEFKITKKGLKSKRNCKRDATKLITNDKGKNKKPKRERDYWKKGHGKSKKKLLGRKLNKKRKSAWKRIVKNKISKPNATNGNKKKSSKNSKMLRSKRSEEKKRS